MKRNGGGVVGGQVRIQIIGSFVYVVFSFHFLDFDFHLYEAWLNKV